MQQLPAIYLKPGKDKPIRHRHHWIFSGAVQSLPSFANGDFLSVYTAGGELLGTGYFNRKSNIVGRMVAFDAAPPLEAIEQRLQAAWLLRKQCMNFQETTAYRLINGEGDGLPGLVVDCYGEALVIQISTLGMDRLRDWLVNRLDHLLHPKCIYEKSLLPSRREEGLKDQQGILKGSLPDLIPIRENGMLFNVRLEKSQKTGFFLDHREMRQWIKTLARGKRVLNAFAYTGGFTIYALAGGAEFVDSVDISGEAVQAMRENVALNQLDAQRCGFFCEDVFQFLREHPLDYQLVILDPPAFAKRQKDVIAACRGYKDINRVAMQKMPAQSLLLTCSCSHYVNEELFQKVLFQAAYEANRQIRIIGRHRLAPDHPINIFHPETAYLKSFLLYLE